MKSLFLYSLPQIPKRSQNSFPSRCEYKGKKSVNVPCSLKHKIAYGTPVGNRRFHVHFSHPFPASASSSYSYGTPEGLGISKFLHGKSCLVTGGTGFLGKVLLEKMLRTDVNKIFVLIKAKSKEDALNRLQTEIIESELFDSLRKIHGKSYKEFTFNKLISVAGNVSEHGLGMDEESAKDISEEVDIIINSAANTNFDERYDTSLMINTRGTAEITSFAKKCKNLLVLLHVSTIYVNRAREGIMMEKPFEMEQSIAREKITTGCDTSLILDVNNEIELAMALSKGSLHDHHGNETTKKLRKLAFERARYFGWRNGYELSKAMGEMVLNSSRGDIPVVILRPSIITSSYKYPFPGWVQGIRVQDPLIILQGQGKLPGFVGDPRVVYDVIPVDMVVNAILGAITKHGIGDMKRDLIIYQVASSNVNPVSFGDMMRYTYNHFVSSPFLDEQGERIKIRELIFLDTIEKLSNYIENETLKKGELMNCTAENGEKSRRLERRYKKIVDRIMHMAWIYEPYVFNVGRFDNENTQKLVEAMSSEESETFNCDVRTIDWKDYFYNIHVPGLRKHVMKGRAG